MKKLILATMLIIGFSTMSNGQEISKNALGLRFGDSNGLGVEISYQRSFGENNRIEFDLGWKNGKNHSGFKLTGLYQWVWNIDEGFNWYAGAGGGLGSYRFDDTSINDETFLFVAGGVGIEYNFDIPLLLSLDVRPELGFGNFRNDVDFDIALGIRYQF